MSLISLLDMRTLLAGNVACLLVCLSVMWRTRQTNGQRFPETAHWLRCFALQFASFFLFLLRGIAPDALSIVLPAFLVTIGYLQFLLGVRRFLNSNHSLRHNHVLLFVFVVVQVYFTYVKPSLFWRSINYSLLLSWLSIECAWIVFGTARDRRFGMTFVANIMLLFAALFLGRVLYYFAVEPNVDFFHVSLYDCVMYLATQVLIVAQTFGLLLSLNRRLQAELEADITRREESESHLRLMADKLAQAELISRTGNWELHLDDRSIVASPGAMEVYGLSESRMNYEYIKTIPLPQFREPLDLAMKALLQHGTPYSEEYMIRDPRSGAIKHIHSIAKLNREQNKVFGVIQDVTERKNFEDELERLVQYDALTGVLSRRYFMSLAERELTNAVRFGRPLSVLMIDIDHFKHINDTFGHQTGDLVLQTIGTEFSTLLRQVDLVGRIGGEEFAIVLPEATPSQSQDVAERLRLRIERRVIEGPERANITVTISIGIALLRNPAANLDSLLAEADRALYEAKHNGRNRIHTAAEAGTALPA